jgi:hypothetical protein
MAEAGLQLHPDKTRIVFGISITLRSLSLPTMSSSGKMSCTLRLGRSGALRSGFEPCGYI